MLQNNIIHYRAIFVFRILLSILLIYDILFIKWENLETLFSIEHGMLNNITVREFPIKNFLFDLSTDFEIKIFFGLSVFVFFIYGIGIFVTITGILSFVCYSLINQRYLLFISGYEQLITLFLFYSVLMQIIIDDKKNHILKKYVSYLIYFQIFCIYFFNFINKNGVTWTSGEALSILFANPSISKYPNNFLLQYPILCKILTLTALLIEFIIALTLLLSYKYIRLRYITSLLIIMLHLMIYLFLDVGYFHVICTFYAVLILPYNFWERLNFLDKFKHTFISIKLYKSIDIRIIKYTIFLFAIIIFYRCVLSSFFSMNKNYSLRNNTIEKLNNIKNANNIFYQRWSMFAPNVNTELGFITIEGVVNSKWISLSPRKPTFANNYKSYYKSDFRNQVIMLLFQNLTVENVSNNQKNIAKMFLENELYHIENKHNTLERVSLVIYSMPYKAFVKNKSYKFERTEYVIAEYN